MPEKAATTPDLEQRMRRSIQDFARRDFDAAAAIFAPDAVWDMSSAGAGVFEGRDAIRGFWEDWLGAYAEWEQEIEEFRDLGHGVTFAVVTAHGRLHGSASWLRLHIVVVGTWGNGLVERQTNFNFTDVDEARTAAERLAEERG